MLDLSHSPHAPLTARARVSSAGEDLFWIKALCLIISHEEFTAWCIVELAQMSLKRAPAFTVERVCFQSGLWSAIDSLFRTSARSWIKNIQCTYNDKTIKTKKCHVRRDQTIYFTTNIVYWELFMPCVMDILTYVYPLYW